MSDLRAVQIAWKEARREADRLRLRAVQQAAKDGRKVPEIAREMGLSQPRIYQLLAEEPEEEEQS